MNQINQTNQINEINQIDQTNQTNEINQMRLRVLNDEEGMMRARKVVNEQRTARTSNGVTGEPSKNQKGFSTMVRSVRGGPSHSERMDAKRFPLRRDAQLPIKR